MATKQINGSYPAGYALNAAYQTLALTTSASVGGAGVTTTTSQSSTINNLGNITGTANGITLGDGGAINNGSAANSSAIIAGETPIVVNGGSATINNYANITSEPVSPGNFDVSVTLNQGGTVSNFANGTISNGVLVSAAAGNVTNNGVVGGGPVQTTYTHPTYPPTYYLLNSGPSIDLLAGGSVANGTDGNVNAQLTNGISIAGGMGTVSNLGTIGGLISKTFHTSYDSGDETNRTYTALRVGYSVSMSKGGTVTNGLPDITSADIRYGVEISGGTGTVTNNGIIGGGEHDTTSYENQLNHFITHSGQHVYYSIYLLQGGTVTNGTGGNTNAVLSNGILITQQAGEIINNGRIGGVTYSTTDYSYESLSRTSRSISSGETYAIQLKSGGSVTNGSASNTGAAIAGISITGNANTVVNYGTISGRYSYHYYRGIYQQPTHSTVATGVAVSLSGGGSVTNGSLDDTAATISMGVEISSGSGTVINYGTISSKLSSGIGITLDKGGSVTNGAVGDSTATISGRIFGILAGSPSTVTNFGTIQGGGGQGAAIYFGAPTLSGSSRLIEEGSGVLIGRVLGGGGTLELGAEAGAGTLTGLGTSILGFATVTVDEGASWSLSGASTVAKNTVLSNSGTLEVDGTITNYGTITGAGGTAISFSSSSGRLIEEGGGIITAAVAGSGGTLELGAKTGAGTLTGLGTSLTGFATVTVDKGASWSLSGPSTVAKNTVLNNSGTLEIDGQITNSGQINNLVGATLAFDGDYGITTDPTIKAGQFSNAGTIEKLVGTGTSIIRTGTASLTDTGTIDVEMGTLELTGATVDITGKIIGAGTIAFGPGSTTLGAGSSITMAGFTIVGTGAVVTMARNLSYAGSFSAGTGTELAIAAGIAFSQNGPASFFRNTLDIDGRLTTAGVTSASVVTVDGTGQWFNSGTLTETNGTLTLGALAGDTSSFANLAAGELDLVGSAKILVGAGTATFTNQGLLSKMGGNTSVIATALTNTGTVEAAKGTLDLQGAVSGKGTLKIDAGQALQADAAIGASQTVQFNGGGDKLLLTDAAQFVAKLQNFGSGDKLDLTQFDPTATTLAFVENAGNTGGTLTVTDGSLTAKIAFLGQYATNEFHTASDGAGGTLITFVQPSTTKTISGSYPSGYALNPAYDTLDITSTASIGGSGVTTTAAHPTTINSVGAIGGSSDNGITLSAGGTIVNGDASNSSEIYGRLGAIVSDAPATIINKGSIHTGVSTSYDHLVYAIDLNQGGSITNTPTAQHASGAIFGGISIAGAAGTVVNDGNIAAPYVYYITGYAGGFPLTAIYHGRAVKMLQGGSVTNGAGNTAAEMNGITITGGTGAVSNFGTIDGSAGKNYWTPAIELETGTVTNGSASDSSATILGRIGVLGDGAVTVINFGKFEGTRSVEFHSSDSRLIEEGSGVLGGTVLGGGGTLELGAKAGPGTLTGLGTSLTGFATVTVDKGASWSLSGPSTVAKNTVLSNSGTLDIDGQIVNSGQINNLSGATFAFDGDYSITTDPTVKAGGFANMGLLEKTAGTGTSTIRTGTAPFSSSGTIDVETGTLTLTGDTITITGKIEGAGTIAFGPGSTTLGAGSTITTAGFTIAGTGAVVTMTRNLSYAGSFSAGTGTELAIAAGTAFSQNGPASFFRNTLDIDGRLTTAGATSASVVTVDGTGQWFNSGTLTETNGTLTLGALAGDTSSFANLAAGELDLVGSAKILVGAGTATFTNQGLLSKMGGNTSVIGTALTNTGTIEAATGTLDLQGAVSGNGTLKIDAGQALQADAAIGTSQTVQFNGGSDKLVLTDATDFAGKLQGFGSGDELDLRQFHPATTTLSFSENAAQTQGVLTVTDGALQAKITLLGQYMASGFHTSSDGVSGGTFVTYTPQAATTIAPPHS